MAIQADDLLKQLKSCKDEMSSIACDGRSVAYDAESAERAIQESIEMVEKFTDARVDPDDTGFDDAVLKLCQRVEVLFDSGAAERDLYEMALAVQKKMFPHLYTSLA